MPTIFVIIIGMKRLAQPNQVLSDDVIIWSVFTKMTDSAILNSFVVSYEAETIKKLLVMHNRDSGLDYFWNVLPTKLKLAFTCFYKESSN